VLALSVVTIAPHGQCGNVVTEPHQEEFTYFRAVRSGLSVHDVLTFI
jgi:hypothetical protein